MAPKPPRAAAAAPAPAPVARGPAAPHVEAFVARHQAAAESASHITGIPAGYILGQAALESGWGRREIRAQGGAPSYNLFGIKASALWQGKTVDTTTTEYVGGRAQQRTERFRAYGSYAEAFEDYARLLRASPRYAAALKAGHSVEAFAREMGRSGYATDPRYGTKLAQVIHTAIQAIA
ncbi:MAG: flagellar assembly peptidoglycan hydrolase FlgJ [Burkholderiales bacterium]|nr:flagellar assembly peptidoglycan hydrolase FlgJ [Burkholderiales bacterium]